MSSSLRFGTLASVFATVLLLAGRPAEASIQFNYVGVIGPNSFNGTLSADSLGGGIYHATSGTLQVVAGALAAQSFLLLPAGPGPTLSPSNLFSVDNLAYPTNNPTLDGQGLLFGDGTSEVNIWGNGPSNYSFWVAAGGGYTVQDDYVDSSVEFTAAVPEATSWAIWGLGATAALALARAKRCLSSAAI